jgi:predicted Zn finger-like uncharacterized protein
MYSREKDQTMSITVNCPHCQQQSIVVEQHNGRNVKCPSCGQSFQVAFPIPDDEHAVVPPTASHEVQSSREVRQQLLGPAIGLIVTGGLTTLMGLMFLPALLFPGLMGEQVPIDPAELVFSLLFMLLSLTLGIITLHGSIKMIQLQSHSLSMAAAIAAMVPCYCCLLGLPMGIWALIVLNDKEVKQAFK